MKIYHHIKYVNSNKRTNEMLPQEAHFAINRLSMKVEHFAINRLSMKVELISSVCPNTCRACQIS